MKSIHYKVGMLIDHPKRPQWGPGKVVAVADDRIHVFFRDDLGIKAKTIITAIVSPSIAESQNDAVLDLLPPAAHNGVDWMLPKNYEKLMHLAGK